MSTKTAMQCTKCKEVLNSEDDIFGTSCGHLYHFLCLRECHGRSTNCTHCESYKPCMFKMFLEFGEQPISWEDQTKTIELHNELEETNTRLFSLEEKYKFSQLTVQQLEGKLKKHNDTLKSKDITVLDLEDRIATLEELNKYLTSQLELKTMNNDQANDRDESMEQNSTISKNQMKKLNSKKLQHLSDQLDDEIAKNVKISTENMKLKALINLTNNENGINSTDLTENVSTNNQNETIDQSKENGEHNEEIITDAAEAISETTIQNTGNTYAQENDESTASSYRETDSHTVLIRNYRNEDLIKPLESVVIEIASRMNLKLAVSDILRILTIKTTYNTVTIIVAFKNDQSKQEFLKNKKCLKKMKCTRHLDICASTK